MTLERETAKGPILLGLGPEVTAKNERLFPIDNNPSTACSMQDYLLAIESVAATIVSEELEFKHVAWPVLLVPESLLHAGLHLNSPRLLRILTGDDTNLIAQAYFLTPMEINQLKEEDSESLAFCANGRIRSAMYYRTQFKPNKTSTQF